MFSTAIAGPRICRGTSGAQGHAIVVDGGDLPTHTLPGGMRLTLLSPSRRNSRSSRRRGRASSRRYGPRARGARGLQPFPARARRRRRPMSTRLPTRRLPETPRAPNGSSIALLAEFGGASALLGADAHAPVLVEVDRKLLRQRGVDRLQARCVQGVASRAARTISAPSSCSSSTARRYLRVDERRSLLPSRSAGDRAHHQVRRRASGAPFQLPDALQRRVGAARPAGAPWLHRDATARTINRAPSWRCFPPEGVRDHGFHQLSAR